MDRIYLMQVFIAVAEEVSLAAAARRLNLSPIAVARAICTVEGQLGTQLVMRKNRFGRLTDAGQRYVDTLNEIISGLAEADSAAIGFRASLKGQLLVAAPIQFGKRFIIRCLSEFMNFFPDIKVSLCFIDSTVNLVEEGIDVAVQIGDLPDSRLKAIRVGQVRLVMVASPSYLAQYPFSGEQPNRLRNTIVIDNEIFRVASAGIGHYDNLNDSRLRPRLIVTTDEAAIEAALAGVGTACLWTHQVAPYVAAGDLQILYDARRGKGSPVQVLHREGKFGSLKVRTFIDMLVMKLRGEIYLR